MSAQKLPPNYVLVIFGDGIPAEIKGPCLMAFEADLRRHSDAEVFLETRRDQNKLRRDLTREDII